MKNIDIEINYKDNVLHSIILILGKSFNDILKSVLSLNYPHNFFSLISIENINLKFEKNQSIIL